MTSAVGIGQQFAQRLDGAETGIWQIEARIVAFTIKLVILHEEFLVGHMRIEFHQHGGKLVGLKKHIDQIHAASLQIGVIPAWRNHQDIPASKHAWGMVLALVQSASIQNQHAFGEFMAMLRGSHLPEVHGPQGKVNVLDKKGIIGLMRVGILQFHA